MKSPLQVLRQTWTSFTHWLWIRQSRNGPTLTTSSSRPPKVLCMLRKQQGTHEAFELTLKQKGCEVITTYDGQKGIELAHLEHPDVVIVDELVSGMDGFKVYTAIQADNELSRIPLVFIESGRLEHEPWRRPSKDVLRLPAGPQEILGAVEYVLSGRPSVNTIGAQIGKIEK